VNAEDPFSNFMPSTGRITHSILPTGPGVRIDTGVYPGFEITPYYDPMIAKLIVWGETRAQAILRMRRALEEYRIVGVRTNIPFHQTLMDSHRFMGGQFDTRFVEERFSMEAAAEKVDEAQARSPPSLPLWSLTKRPNAPLTSSAATNATQATGSGLGAGNECTAKFTIDD
jgi:acetyl/propionyl-CoA carboxylase alpha subunit